MALAKPGVGRGGRGEAPRERAPDDLLSGLTEMVSAVTVGGLLVVLLDNGPAAPRIKPDVPDSQLLRP